MNNIYLKKVDDNFDPTTLSPIVPFPQSRLYNLWQREFGRKNFRFLCVDKGTDVFFLQSFVYKLKGIEVVYAPQGPLFGSSIEEKHMDLLKDLFQDILLENKYLFSRFDVSLPSPYFKRARRRTLESSFMQPKEEMWVDIEDTDKVLKNFSKTTRYSINKAERGLSVERAKINKESIDDFLNLLTKTAIRSKFSLHPEDYYRKLFEIGGESIDLFFAKSSGVRVATVLVVSEGDLATYLFGGTDGEGLEKCAQYLLNWSAMKEMSGKGKKIYSLGGVGKGKLDGVTRFKSKFGGFVHSFGPSYDLVRNPFLYEAYNMYKLFK